MVSAAVLLLQFSASQFCRHSTISQSRDDLADLLLPNIACGENSRAGGPAVLSSGNIPFRSGFHHTLVELRRRAQANGHENASHLQGPGLSLLLDHHAGDLLLSQDLLHLGLKKDFNVLPLADPFHQGFLSCLDDAENAFVSAYRKYKDKLNFDIFIEYIASPRLDGKVLVITDPMLATGGSMELSYKALLTKGTPKSVHVASVIASRQAIDYVKQHFPDDTTLWVGAIDDQLDDHSYIVPGLGDAGDLAYGIKE